MDISIRNECKSKVREACAAMAAVSLLALALYGCQPATSSDSSDKSDDSKAKESITLTDWSPATDCTTCHANEASSESDASCTASKHTSLSCSNCHTDTEKLAKVHNGVSYNDRQPTRLKHTEVSSEVCLSCHDKSELAQKTVSVTALTDSNGKTVNPHDLPATETHEAITCTNCHAMHSEQTDLDGDAKAYCTSCHHADVFECYTCHQHS
ncbi:cytochrome c3 family protein [Slackia exigua]